jgi:hypothetical protein
MDATALLMSITCQPYFMLVPEYFSIRSFVQFCKVGEKGFHLQPNIFIFLAKIMFILLGINFSCLLE